MHSLDTLKEPDDQPGGSSEALGQGALRSVDVTSPQIPNQMSFDEVERSPSPKRVKIGSTVTLELYDNADATPKTLTLEVAEERTGADQVTPGSAVGHVIMDKPPSNEKISLPKGKFVKILDVV